MTQVRHSPDASRLPLPSTIAARDGAFHSTQWSLVLAAGFDSPAAQHALEKLCQRYWPPLYAFIRRQGYTPHDAQDLTQAFFERLLEKNYLDQVDRAKGKFRSFLLAAVKHFLADARDRQNAQKRGGGQTFISTDELAAEERSHWEPATNCTAEHVFERRWALTVLDGALRRLRREFESAGRLEEFQRMQRFLEGEVQSGDYVRAAPELETTPGALAVAVKRLRRRYGELVRFEIAQTVGSSEAVSAELAHLREVLTRGERGP